MLGKGRPLCFLEMHPDDAADRGVSDGDTVTVTGQAASLEVLVKVTDEIAQGVVAMPHGFSSEKSLNQENLTPGENYNRLVAAAFTDGPSATVALNGVPVTVEPGPGITSS